MAVTHKAIVRIFLTRRGSVEALAKWYKVSEEYVENCIRREFLRRASKEFGS